MIEFENLHVVFADRSILSGVDLKVADGEVVVLTGANGSGKTTMFRTAAGAVVPSTGRVMIDGRRQDSLRTVEPVSYVSDRRIVWPVRTPREMLLGFASMLGLSRNDAVRRVGEICARIGIEEYADKPQERLSTGQASRFALARMLVRPFRNVLVDEPSAGLDAEAAAMVRSEMRRLADEGHAVIVTSHRMEEIMSLPDRIAVLKGGRIVSDVTPAEAISSGLFRKAA